MNRLIVDLQALLGARHVLTAEPDIAPFCTDWRGRYTGQALCVALPGCTADVAAIVEVCRSANIPIVPQGGNTGLCGGATPVGGEVLVCFRRMNAVRSVDVANNTITAESGCTLAAIQNAAAASDRLFPLSLAAEGSATIGGNLSTNAGGVQVLRYGSARDLTLGLEVVLADGRIWNGLRALRKDNTGYDLKHLFIGSEGTLGLITAATLKLYPRPRLQTTAWVAVPDPAAAVHLLALLRDVAGDNVTAFELIGRTAFELVLGRIPGARSPLRDIHSWQILVELSGAREDLSTVLEAGLQAALEKGIVIDAALASSEVQAAELWALRENIPEAQRVDGISIKHDVSLPLSRIDEFVTRADRLLSEKFPGLRIVCFGHVGDGNLHYNVSKPGALAGEEFVRHTAGINRLVHDLVNELEGSISAEHGLGQLKREEILRYKSPVEMEMMCSVKRALDPNRLFNPGKVI